MKRVCSFLVAFILIFSLVASMTASANITDPTKVGSYAGEFVIAPGFSEGDLTAISKAIRAEYNRSIATRNFQNASIYFDYGNATGELVHQWAGSAHEGDVGAGTRVFGPYSCMNQDFSGGGSSCPEAFSQGSGWCCILVTTASLKKGEAYTIRDDIGQLYAAAGGTNSMWGMPTSNQFWVDTNTASSAAGAQFVEEYPADTGYYLVQNFDEGFAILADGRSYYSGFFFYETGYSAPAYNGVADNPEVAANTPIKSSDGPSLINADEVIIPEDVVFTMGVEDTTIHNYDEEEDGGGDTVVTTVEGEDGAEGDATEADTASEAEGGDPTAEATTSTVTSRVAGTAATTTTYLFGMPLDQAMPILIGIIAAVVVIIAVIIILVVVSSKKKKAAALAAGAEAAEAGAEEAPAEEVPAEEAAEEAPAEETAE